MLNVPNITGGDGMTHIESGLSAARAVVVEWLDVREMTLGHGRLLSMIARTASVEGGLCGDDVSK